MNNPSELSKLRGIQSIHQLNTLIKISQSVISTLDLQEVLQIVSDGMAELLGIETAAIYLIENNNDLLLSATTPPLDPNMPLALRQAHISDHPNIERALKSKKAHIIADALIVELSPAEKFVVEIRKLKSLMFLPFIQKEMVIGVLILGTCNTRRVFSENEMEFGQTIANQLSMAIQNAKLHADLNKHKDHLEELVIEKTKDLDAAIEELKASNEELSDKNKIINDQNVELKAILQHLKQTQAQLFQSEKMASLGNLTAGIAHEINNPLNFILGSTNGLEEILSNTDLLKNEDVQVYLNCLKTGIDRITGIVSGLNQFSRDNLAMDEDCYLHSIIDNCLNVLSGQIKNRIEIEKCYFDSPFIIKGNVGKMHQVFLNLLTNSIQAIKDVGKITIKTTQTANNQKLIEIIDTGTGIDESIIDRITEPFFTTKEPGKGTGLGLTITYNIIKEHEGTLYFDSLLNKGTNARIVFR